MKAFHWLLPPHERHSRRHQRPARHGGIHPRRAREIAAGHVVCIFAEGAISRTGNMLPFKRGFEKIVEGLDVPIIPVHLDRLWGSIFSFAGGKFFWKWPTQIPYPVTVSFGEPLPSSATAQAVARPFRNSAPKPPSSASAAAICWTAA